VVTENRESALTEAVGRLALPAGRGSWRSSTRQELTAVIVNWNTRGLLTQCLDSLAAIREATALEVTVVDNASTDDSTDVCRSRYPWVRVLANGTNVGYGAASNQGIEACGSEFVLLLNSDTVVSESAIPLMLETMRRNEGVGLVGCRLLNVHGTVQWSCMRFPNLALLTVQELLLYRLVGGCPRMFVEPPLLTAVTTCDWVYGAAMLIRRDAYRQVGGFDTGIWMYGEEMELCYRLAEAGWKVVFDPRAEVVHLGEGSWKSDSPLPKYLRAKGLIRFYEKHRSTARTLAARALVGVGGLIRMGGWAALGVSSALTGKRWDSAAKNARAYWSVLLVCCGLSSHGK
jgi:GT2 family glycosyltransferase